jgi:hypothetical protein
MKRIALSLVIAFVVSFIAKAQTTPDQEIEKKAAEWVTSLSLNDAQKEARVKAVIATHLTTTRNWHNEHPSSTIPEGINPVTGTKLSELDRSIIADSAMPSTIHQDLMNGLKKDLTTEQVELVLDKIYHW